VMPPATPSSDKGRAPRTRPSTASWPCSAECARSHTRGASSSGYPCSAS
jgi:hypothetical protein